VSFLDAEGDPRALRLLRALLGPIVLLHLAPFLADLRAGHWYGDTFTQPWFAWYPEAPRALYAALLWATAAAALLMMVPGRTARLANVAAAALVAYNFFLSQTHFHHNRAYLVIVLALVALVPARGARVPLWPLFLLRFEHATTYFASGFSKLIDPDWWGGVVTWDRVLRHRAALDASVAPEWLKSLVTDERFHQIFAKANVLTELFLAVGLWFRPTRLAAIWVALAFHLMIEISAQVQAFSYLAIATLLVWATPRTCDRVLVAGPRFARLVRALDWLARFRVEEGELRVVDRDGRQLRGGAAVRFVLSRLPLTFFFVAPFARQKTYTGSSKPGAAST
jgi:hypothetical protein